MRIRLISNVVERSISMKKYEAPTMEVVEIEDVITNDDTLGNKGSVPGGEW